jgi:hypothetical protein
MKLKTNKTFIKWTIPKFKNQKNKDWNWNTNNQEGRAVIFRRKEREKKNKKKFTNDKSNYYRSDTRIAPIGRGHVDTYNDAVKGFF